MPVFGHGSASGPAIAALLNGKDLVPASHPLAVGVVGTYSRESANRVVARADLVCFVGSEAGGMTTHGWSHGLGAAPSRAESAEWDAVSGKIGM